MSHNFEFLIIFIFIFCLILFFYLIMLTFYLIIMTCLIIMTSLFHNFDLISWLGFIFKIFFNWWKRVSVYVWAVQMNKELRLVIELTTTAWWWLSIKINNFKDCQPVMVIWVLSKPNPQIVYASSYSNVVTLLCYYNN